MRGVNSSGSWGRTWGAGAADAASLAVDAADALLSLGASAHFPSPSAAAVRARARALVAAIVAAPAPVAASLAAGLGDATRSLQDRLDVLDALAAAARELASPPQAGTAAAAAAAAGVGTRARILAAAPSLITIMDAIDADDAASHPAPALQNKSKKVLSASPEAAASAGAVVAAAPEGGLSLDASQLAPHERAAVGRWRVEARASRRPLARAAAAAAARGPAASKNRFSEIAYRCFFQRIVGRVDAGLGARLARAQKQREMLLMPEEGGSGVGLLAGIGLGTAGMTHATMLSQDPFLLTRVLHTLAVFVHAAGPYCLDAAKMSGELLELAAAARDHPEAAVRRGSVVGFITVADTLPLHMLTGDLGEGVANWTNWLQAAVTGAERDEQTVVLGREALLLLHRKAQDESTTGE